MEACSTIFAQSPNFAVQIILINCIPAIQAGINSYCTAQQLEHRLTSGPRCASVIYFARGPNPCSALRSKTPSEPPVFMNRALVFPGIEVSRGTTILPRSSPCGSH